MTAHFLAMYRLGRKCGLTPALARDYARDCCGMTPVAPKRRAKRSLSDLAPGDVFSFADRPYLGPRIFVGKNVLGYTYRAAFDAQVIGTSLDLPIVGEAVTSRG